MGNALLFVLMVLAMVVSVALVRVSWSCRRVPSGRVYSWAAGAGFGLVALLICMSVAAPSAVIVAGTWLLPVSVGLLIFGIAGHLKPFYDLIWDWGQNPGHV